MIPIILIGGGILAFLLFWKGDRPILTDPEDPSTIDPLGREVQRLINEINRRLEQAAADQQIAQAAPGSPEGALLAAIPRFPAPNPSWIFPGIIENGYMGEATQQALTNYSVLMQEADVTDYAHSQGTSWVQVLDLDPVESVDLLEGEDRLAVLSQFRSFLAQVQTYPQVASTSLFFIRYRVYLLLGKLLNQRR